MRLVKEGKLDRFRTDKALGLALSKRFQENHHGYRCTENECNCPDAVERWVTCKHQIAIAFLKVSRELEKDDQRSKDNSNDGAKLPSPVRKARSKRAAVPGAGGELPRRRPGRPRTNPTKGITTR